MRQLQLTAPRNGKPWGVPKRGSPVSTTMRVLKDKIEMDLHMVEKWAWLTKTPQRAISSPEQ